MTDAQILTLVFIWAVIVLLAAINEMWKQEKAKHAERQRKLDYANRAAICHALRGARSGGKKVRCDDSLQWAGDPCSVPAEARAEAGEGR